MGIGTTIPRWNTLANINPYTPVNLKAGVNCFFLFTIYLHFPFLCTIFAIETKKNAYGNITDKRTY